MNSYCCLCVTWTKWLQICIYSICSYLFKAKAKAWETLLWNDQHDNIVLGATMMHSDSDASLLGSNRRWAFWCFVLFYCLALNWNAVLFLFTSIQAINVFFLSSVMYQIAFNSCKIPVLASLQVEMKKSAAYECRYVGRFFSGALGSNFHHWLSPVVIHGFSPPM